eukprot:gene30087-15719_t
MATDSSRQSTSDLGMARPLTAPPPLLNVAGRDATAAFWRLHAPEVMAEHGPRLRIGAIAGGALPTATEATAQPALTEATETTYDFVI